MSRMFPMFLHHLEAEKMSPTHFHIEIFRTTSPLTVGPVGELDGFFFRTQVATKMAIVASQPGSVSKKKLSFPDASAGS